MEFNWDGTLEMILIIAAVSVAAVYCRSRLELVLCMPSPVPLQLGDSALPQVVPAALQVATVGQLRLPPKVPPPEDENEEEPAPVLVTAAAYRNQGFKPMLPKPAFRTTRAAPRKTGDNSKEADSSHAEFISTGYHALVPYSFRHLFDCR